MEAEKKPEAAQETKQTEETKPEAPAGEIDESGDPRKRSRPGYEQLKTDDPAFNERLRKVLSVGEEVNEPEEVKALLLSSKKPLVVYDGFEPSGRMHIAQGLVRAINVNKLTSSGFIFKFWVADWFAMMNHKLDGNLKKIQNAGKLMIETWKACGMNMENVQFLWSSEEINRNPDQYWSTVLDISTKFSLTRVKKCSPIMGREASDDLAASSILYPVMQCADIFFLKADVCSLGMDQRKVNMLAREYCDKIKRKFKPIILSHHMLMGLDGTKMSKSNPDLAIFMDDPPKEVERKIKKAFCEPGNIETNPILEYVKFIILERNGEIKIVNDPKRGNPGEKIYKEFSELQQDFKDQKVHPGDLKAAVTQALIDALEPVQRHFRENPEAKKLLETVKSYKITK